MALITILNHFISYLSKFINPPARTQETITFPEMIRVPYVWERVFYVWINIVYPRVYHTNEPIKFPKILADGHEHQTSSSWIVPSVLATEVTPLLFLKPNSAILVKNAEVHGERIRRDFQWQEPVVFLSAILICVIQASGSVFSHWSTGAWFWGVNRFNCLAYKNIFCCRTAGLNSKWHT